RSFSSSIFQTSLSKRCRIPAQPGIHDPITSIEAHADPDIIPYPYKEITRELGFTCYMESLDKFAAFKAILAYMHEFKVLLIRRPFRGFLISDNRDFSPVLVKLNELGCPFLAAQLNAKGEILEWHGLNKNTQNNNSELVSTCESYSRRLVILWDLKRCRVPKGIPYDAVAGNIKSFLAGKGIDAPITIFNVYGDASKLPKSFIKACNKTGISIIDEKDTDSVLKTILVDMVISSIDEPFKSQILLISGRGLRHFKPVLRSINLHTKCVLLAIPNLKKERPNILMDFGEFVWEWPAMAMGAASA
ncbi:hypothetical protein KI387_033570, partial [Taxus chinensis]